MNNSHDIVLDNGPTLLEKNAREAIRPRGPVARHEVNGSHDLIISDGGINTGQINRPQVEVLPV